MTTDVVTAVVTHHGDVLLLRRSNRVRTYRGKWACVSGYLEEGEKPEERAVIEIEEETGLTGSEVRLEKTATPVAFTDETAGVDWRVHPFLFTTTNRDIAIDWEHQEYRWVAPSALERYDTVPRLGEVVNRLLA
ncbi:MAG: NUDIX domain-containing protein [Candidatus Thermoplasmatota archaeon]|nr:NUDIX domain-containing protein [Candidatus Thermoplasmatota archaeon]